MAGITILFSFASGKKEVLRNVPLLGSGRRCWKKKRIGFGAGIPVE
jgi:hypothetical protein